MANKLYQESAIQDIAAAIRLKADENGKTYKVAEMDNAVLDLGFSNIPSYHYEEAGKLVEKILAKKAECPNNICFGVTTDSHVYRNTEPLTEKSARHSAFALETVGVMAGLDFNADFGDDCSENGIDTDNAVMGVEYFNKSIQCGQKRKRTFRLVGNHDTSSSTQKIYNLIGVHNEFDGYGYSQIRGFGYKDFADKKVRVICLNTSDYMNIKGGNGMSYDQKDFLIRALDLSAKSDFADWQIILLSHIPLDYAGGDYNKYADLNAILTAYINGTSVSITVNSSYAKNETPSNYATYNGGALVYNYAGKNSAKIIANFHGHIHNDCYKKMSNGIWRMCAPNTCFNGDRLTAYPESGDYTTTDPNGTLTKANNSVKDTAATFYVIDLDEQTIYSFAYGAGRDRTVIYKEAKKYSVTYNLTDVTSSNTASEAVEGSSFTATLSVGKDFALDTVTVKMGGTDITSSAYSNGVITIANVTGNIVITAVAKENYVPHWDIGDRTAVTNLYATKDQKKAFDRTKYYYGAARSGMVDYRYITSCTVSGNDVTFTGTTKNTGVGLPYHLEAGATYTFSAKASATGRLGWVVFNADGTLVSGSGGYSPSGTSPTVTITAPADTSQWVVVVLECYTANASVTYSNISLTKN